MTILIATRNARKAGEIRAMLARDIRVLTLNDFPGAPPAVEDAPDFAGNAAKKSGTLARWLASGVSNSKSEISSCRVLADDSGLEVDALNGAPGVHSARFAALDPGGPGNADDAANNMKLLRLLKDVPAEKRTARFRCVIALTEFPPARDGPWETRLFDGTCEGRIALEPGGPGGFGYDPLFVPNGYEQTFAELGNEIKNRISHRARA